MSSNDNHTATGSLLYPIDGRAHAALILVESLIHGLCEKSMLSVEEAAEIVDRAIAVQQDHAIAGDEAAASLWQGHASLQSIAASLKIDL